MVELSTAHETILEHCLTVELFMEELSLIDELSEIVEEVLIVEFSDVYKVLEVQLDEADDAFVLSEESLSESLDINSSKDSPLAPPPPPPPLQEITRRLKLKTIRKKRSFFIYFP